MSDSDGRTASYFIGLDLGKRQDYTALTVVAERETQERATRRVPDSAQVQTIRRWTFSGYWLQHLQRWPLGTKYKEIAADVAELTSRPVFRSADTTLVVDRGGVGESVYEQIARRVEDVRVDLMGVTITGGKKVTPAGPQHYNVPKTDLVAALQVAVQNGEVKAASELELWETLRGEMESFTSEVTQRGERFEARQGEHDDLVLALAMPVWLSDWRRRREAKSTPLPRTQSR